MGVKLSELLDASLRVEVRDKKTLIACLEVPLVRQPMHKSIVEKMDVISPQNDWSISIFVSKTRVYQLI